jgi:hypothetical protein
MTLERLLRKVWLILFTRNPYKIRNFSEIYQEKVGQQLAAPENVSAVLLKETGSYIVYPDLIEDGLNKIKHQYIGGKKRYKIAGIFKEPDRRLYSLSNGCSLGPLGLVYDREKRVYINESAKEWSINLKESVYTNVVNFPPRIFLPGLTFSCLTNGADAGFYHFLFESIVKIEFYKPVIDQAKFLLFNGPANDWKIKWLCKAGIPLDKVIWVDNTGHYECEQLIFSNRLINDQQIGNWCIKSLKKLFKISFHEKEPDTQPYVLLITRNGFVRHIEWERNILEQFPFIKKISLSDLDVEATIQELQNATHVIGPHGAGLSNIYLCRPGTKILEIYPNDKTYQPCYYRVSCICELSYSVIYLDFENADNEEFGLDSFKKTMADFLCS